MGEGFPRRIAITIKQATAVDGLVEPLVRIEGNRVGQVQSFELLRSRQRRQDAEGAVDMEPKTFGLRDFRDLTQWIDGAGGHRAHAGHDRHGRFS